MASKGTDRVAPRRIAVAGNPNTGKTTLFNALTGLRHQVGNYAGVTVERRQGRLVGADADLLDLPGTYSLSARSPDQRIARDALLGRLEAERQPDAVLLVVDASNLERNLFLATQVLELGLPTVIACNMMDHAAARGLTVDCAALSELLGVPVIPTIASRGEGIAALRQALRTIEPRPDAPRGWRLPPPIEDAVGRAADALRAADKTADGTADARAVLWMTDYLSGEPFARQSAERFLETLPRGAADSMRQSAADVLDAAPDAAGVIVETRYAWISELVGRSVSRIAGGTGAHDDEKPSPTDRIDRIVTHRILGPAVFAAVMFVLFLSIFSWAEPIMDLIESGQAALSGYITARMADGPLRSLLTDGVISGVGAVLIFFPQICILFLCLGLLEDSGYMARAAFLMDRVMARVGLHGRSFIPLLSSYACAIPGIMATRTIEDRRDRFTTILVAPLMSCSARLPIYIILIAAVFGDRTWLKAGILFGMYALGTVTALLMAMVFKKTLFAGPRPTFIMELPPYHLPRPWPIIRAVWDRAKLFLTGAGTTILALCIVIWALSYFPRTDVADFPPDVQARLTALDESQAAERADLIAGERLRRSYLGRLGRTIEPAIEPLGFDWRIGIGVLGSFVAREVFVSTMGITFSVGEADETSQALREQFAAAAWPDGRPVLTPLTAVGLMVFYVLACQCISTLAVVRRETGSWKWPAFMFGYMTALAYGAALVIHQIGGRLGSHGA